MIDIILIEEDLNYIKNLINELSDYNKDIRISKCITTVSELENNIEKYNFDVILLDISLLNLFHKYLTKYKNSLILNISENDSKIDKCGIPFVYKKDTIDIVNRTINS